MNVNRKFFIIFPWKRTENRQNVHRKNYSHANKQATPSNSIPPPVAFFNLISFATKID